MNKHILLCILGIGVLLLVASVVITIAAAKNANIIGGAGWPTLMFCFDATGADWLAFLGVLVTLISSILLAVRKK